MDQSQPASEERDETYYTIDRATGHRLTINELSARIADWRERKGFVTDTINIPEKLALLVEEVTEMFDCLHDVDHFPMHFDESGKPCGFIIERADALIRVLDLAASLHVNIGNMIDAVAPTGRDIATSGSFLHLCAMVSPPGHVEVTSHDLMVLTRDIMRALDVARTLNPPPDAMGKALAVIATSIIALQGDINSSGQPFARAVALKMAYNETRAPKYGRKF